MSLHSGSSGRLEDGSTVGSGCIEGMRCPRCGNHEEFQVSMTCMAMVGADGTYDEQDMEWDEDSLCICPVCDRNGTVAEFTPTKEAT